MLSRKVSPEKQSHCIHSGCHINCAQSCISMQSAKVCDIEDSAPREASLLKDTHYAVCCCSSGLSASYPLCECAKAAKPSADGPLFVPKGLISALSVAGGETSTPGADCIEGDVSDTEPSAKSASPATDLSVCPSERSPERRRFSDSTDRALRSVASDVLPVGDSLALPATIAQLRMSSDSAPSPMGAEPAVAAPVSVAELGSASTLASPNERSAASVPAADPERLPRDPSVPGRERLPREQSSGDAEFEEACNLGLASPPVSRRTSIDAPSLLASVAANRRLKRVFTREEVRQHHRTDDCWMIVAGEVYDITAYIGYHPGGTRALMKFAGRDGTENVEFHSPEMMRLLRTYFYVGRLEGADAGRRCVIS
eukprot:TRINITY_DN2352_c0_g1_i1.p1 TRINITY_DN2352_c0_g1~~TRINITY_DN2352_c0_g1_i1.p1  ORF type:complete len:370 (-),score=52.05 TRINITY_DN2352_c0_g1_i1:223-1332(-)